MADDFTRFDLTNTCPGCGAPLTRKAVGRSVELLHPQPPCPDFRAFVARMLQRQADQRARRAAPLEIVAKRRS